MTGRMPPILVLGATGLLGQALLRAGYSRGLEMVGAARHAEEPCDVTDRVAVFDLLARRQPRVVVNAAALTDIAACEADPAWANAVNGQAVATLAEACRRQGCRLVHISTDHFFSGDGDALHDESAAVQLVNEYARSKFAGEAFALDLPEALVVRTNVTGFRNWADKPTFAEWLFDAIEADADVTLFEDFVTSTIDAASLAYAVLDLLDRGSVGLLNVAAREPATKKQFAEAVARRLGKRLTRCRTGSVLSLRPRRAESLGLDVRRAEAALGYRLPTLDDVAVSLVREYRDRCATIRHSR